MQPALGLVLAGPAALAAAPGPGARRASDRVVAAVVQRVVGEVVLGDVAPHVLVRPVGERVHLVEPVGVVPVQRSSAYAGRRLLAADPRDPRLQADERALERVDLAVRAAAVGRPGPAVRAARVEHLDLHAPALLEGAPGLDRLGEQDARVDREDARLGLDGEQHVEHDRLLLLEGAGHGQARVEALERLLERLGGGQTAHSPSPRMTSNGTLRSQSMNVCIVSRLNSGGRARSRTTSSNSVWPTRSANVLNASPSWRSAS